MLAQVVDAVVVGNVAVLVRLVNRAEAVLDHKERLLVAVVDLVDGDAEAQRVDRPTPVGVGEVGVLHARERIARGVLGARVGRSDRAGVVIAERDEVDGVLGENLLVLLGHAHVDALALEHLECVVGIIAAALNVNEEVVLLAANLCLAHVLGVAGVGVERAGGEHAADLVLGIDLVADLGCPSACDELVVGGDVLGSDLVLALFEDQACAHEGHMQDHVDLVEGEPVLNKALVAREEHRDELLVHVDKLAVAPAAVLLDKVDRAVEVRDGHERLDTVLLALAEEILVELQALFVGLGLVAVGEDAGPADGQTVRFEAHLGEKRDVLLVVVVHVDGLLGRVEVPVLKFEHLARAATDRLTISAVRHHVDVGQAAAALVVRALALVGRRSAAPQETLRKSHVLPFRHGTAHPTAAPRCTAQRLALLASSYRSGSKPQAPYPLVYGA